MPKCKRGQFRTGYSDLDLVRDALSTGVVKGTQKSKRDKLKHGIRYGDGQAESARSPWGS